MERKIRRILRILLIVVLILVGSYSLIYIYNKNSKNPVLERKIQNYLDYSNSIELFNDGYVVVGSNNHNNNKMEKAKLSIYDKDRNKIIEKIYNKGYSSSFYDGVTDNDTYVVVGNYASSKDENDKSRRIALIVKYDKNGEVLFEKDFSVNSNSKYSSIISVDDGYIVAGGSINSMSEQGNSGAVLVKYDKSGEEIFRKYTGKANATYNDVITFGKYIYAVGSEGNRGLLSIYTLDGEVIDNIYYNNMDRFGFSSISCFNGALFICGGKIIENNVYGLIVKYNLDGLYLEEYADTKYTNVSFKKVVSDDEGNAIVIGNSSNYDSGEFSSDGVIAKYSYSLSRKNFIMFSNDRTTSFNDIELYGNKYAVVGDIMNDTNVSSKLFLFSKSLKSLGV